MFIAKVQKYSAVFLILLSRAQRCHGHRGVSLSGQWRRGVSLDGQWRRGVSLDGQWRRGGQKFKYIF